MTGRLQTDRGRPIPFGIARFGPGHNFALFSRNATSVSLLLYFKKQKKPDHEVILDPVFNRTGDVWHISVRDLPERFYYMYRVDGPWQPEVGHVFNRDRLLLDPYVKFIAGLDSWGNSDRDLDHLLGVYEETTYNWGDDKPPNTPLSDSLIYELHVRGFSRHNSSNVSQPGTYRAVVEKIDYLKKLGVTAVELLPVQEFDETDCRYINPDTGEKLLNYWGYSTIGFFALKTAYSSRSGPEAAVCEFKDMVKALHAANLEVILDVVFNHTAEGDRDCSVLNFKGIENSTYYILDDEGDYQNHSGCGNTLNCNHPVVLGMIMDALRYWVAEMHVDGFRFDLASILTRNEKGDVLTNPPLLEAVAKDPVLSGIKLIAEPWDASGLYQVGGFPAYGRWAEWNGQFRDTIRRFVSGEPGVTSEVASRVSGSEDLYRFSDRRPFHSINFITAHDGFTMMDLASYQHKHNGSNGQENLDGENRNFSMNFGIEGPSSDPVIVAKRKQQIRNMATLLLLSQGTPMLLAGDEFGNSQFGNNNAWCQDNETSWLNWNLLSENRDIFDFWRRLIEFRKSHAALGRKQFFTGEINNHTGIADISWHNSRPGEPEFHTPSRSLSFLIDGMAGNNRNCSPVYVAANFDSCLQEFELPAVPLKKPWQELLSTSNPDAFLKGRRSLLPEHKASVEVAPFSVTVLIQ